MDFSYFKYLSYINKHGKISWVELTKHFNISKSETIEIVSTLKQQGYISYRGDTQVISTIKGKSFIKSFILKWLSKNILPIIAIIISIIALFN